ncbi:MAG: hypothetical protein DMF56_01575 [Acidobacteria bacterium]|nr:MAG: hypothetical protein DMF56_01575 [Acidobacteriota bacterium]
MSRGCAMVRCPHCGYEYVESGRFADMLRRWIRRGPEKIAEDGEIIPVAEMRVGSSAPVAYITPSSPARLNRLASYGIAAGSDVRLIAKRPAVVLACGSSSIAIEDDVAREIYVRNTNPAA